MHSRHGATEREGAHKGRIKRDSESANKRTVGQTQLLCINRKRQSKKHQGEGSFHGDTHSLRAGIGFSNISSAPALPASAKGTRLARARATRRPHGRHQQPRSLGDVCLNPLARSYSQHHTTQSPRREGRRINVKKQYQTCWVKILHARKVERSRSARKKVQEEIEKTKRWNAPNADGKRIRGGSLVRTRLSVCVMGSFPGSFFNADHRGTLPLARYGKLRFSSRLARYHTIGLQLIRWKMGG
jgi:hypothetical protein